MNNFTGKINDSNVNNVRVQIARKKQSVPYHATAHDSSGVITDYDSFPYTRWFRGVPESSKPIVAEREAGWRPRHDRCYRFSQPAAKSHYPNHCFQGPCHFTHPCYPEYLTKYADEDILDTIINKACIVQYR